MFPDASSLALAACSAAYACGPGADWAQFQSVMADVQHALDTRVHAQPEAAAEQGDDWGIWDEDSVIESSRPSIQDRSTDDSDLTSVGSQLSTVR